MGFDFVFVKWKYLNSTLGSQHVKHLSVPDTLLFGF